MYYHYGELKRFSSQLQYYVHDLSILELRFRYIDLVLNLA